MFQWCPCATFASHILVGFDTVSGDYQNDERDQSDIFRQCTAEEISMSKSGQSREHIWVSDGGIGDQPCQFADMGPQRLEC
jgi:hypothetical protein